VEFAYDLMKYDSAKINGESLEQVCLKTDTVGFMNLLEKKKMVSLLNYFS